MIILKSVINTPQTLDTVALPAFATQKRASATAAIIAAAAARTCYYAELKGDNSDLGIGKNEYQYVPVTTDTIALPDDAEVVRIQPAGTIAALTVNPPANPRDGQELTLLFSQIVTALTMTGLNSQVINGALTAATAQGFATWKYEKGANDWYRTA
jgi:hypothetical protein